VAHDDVCQSPDYRATAEVENAYLATGYNMLGLNLATAVGRLFSRAFRIILLPDQVRAAKYNGCYAGTYDRLDNE
jgi:hypothetical protein